MNHLIIGEQIQKFRKAAGLTQKELGEALGVSSSAVSQWETGGTPDISLLPAMADRLGVTVDALFGREEITWEKMDEALPRYLASLPEEKRLEEICRLMWAVMKAFLTRLINSEGQLIDDSTDLSDSIDLSDRFQIRLCSDTGIMAGAAAGEMPFLWVFPEPEQGYAASFAPDDEYRRLFLTLSRPYALELLKFLYQRPPKHCTADVIVKRLGFDGEEIRSLLSEFAQLGLVRELELETENGDTKVYHINDCGGLVPFLYAAGMMIEGGDAVGFVCSQNNRKRPLLYNPADGPKGER